MSIHRRSCNKPKSLPGGDKIVMDKHILVLGSINMDLVVTAPRNPEIGETILGSDFHTFPGGKGANQSVAASRLGGRVKLIGRLGLDPFGMVLRQTITAGGVDDTWIRDDPETPTGVAVITIGAEGQNTIVVAAGANNRVSPEDVTAAEDAFQNAAMLLVQLEVPLPAVRTAIQIAQRHSIPVILNPAPTPALALDDELITGVDYLIPNQNELVLLAGGASIGESARVLFQAGVKKLIVTLGKEGALLVSGGREQHIPAFRVNAVDTTAAGDAFIGAFAVALSEGLPLAEAVRWGNAAGALAATRPGAQPSLPTRRELQEFLQAGSV